MRQPQQRLNAAGQPLRAHELPPALARDSMRYSIDVTSALGAFETMHRIQPARLKPGVSLASPPESPQTGDASRPRRGRLSRGRALVSWGPKGPGTRTRSSSSG